MSDKTTFASPLMSPKEAAALTTMSKSLLAAMAAEGHFPKPRQIGVRRIAYVRAEVLTWIESRIAGVAA
ncbi:helix-turn-helix transcriptional regulator [Rhizobium sp. BR 315]|uniref:helix-turn-helix transcriptional regulator n=1 Tax=Rhizobium sp. BR 315 TaxID=3040014 RepID=UPI003D325DF0